MNAYVSTSDHVGSVANIADKRRVLTMSYERTTSQKAETKFIHGGIFSGAVLAALLAFMNIGASTTPSHSNLNSVKPVVMPAISRSETEEHEEDNDNLAQESDCLQKLFGLNTSQWAKILKVERKTIYNWRKAPETKVKANAADRILVLQQFAKEFNPLHGDFLSKFMFGRKSDVGLLTAFLKEPLDLNEMLAQYDNIYTKLDGLVKRKALLGE
ncbi:hypothetical protein [Pseudescherichia sp.]|uniref:hypothetical protein n=1 Tax=Pseudescherichia sp. TaxID=2055881 RepID=UPI002896CE45|nr:hypothetical protein [Pseudescherichia sp.]WPO96939.1 hypothetical protein SFA32_08345 [Buttiauxella sp. HR94]